jgi:hypothetical protein
MLTLFLTCVVLLADVRQVPQVLVDQWDQKVVRRSVLIPPSEFSPARAEEISRAFLTANRDKFTVLKLSIFVDENDERRTDSGKGSTDVTYMGWRQLYEKYGSQPLPMAQTIAIRENAVLRWRDAGGRVGRKVLSGSDPLAVRLAGRTFEVLELAMHKRSPYHVPLPSDPIWVNAAVRTSATSADHLRAFTSLLAARLGLTDLSISFRHDCWFISGDSFPIVYRFDQVLNPPTEGEYRRAFAGYCWFSGGKTSCQVPGPP